MWQHPGHVPDNGALFGQLPINTLAKPPPAAMRGQFNSPRFEIAPLNTGGHRNAFHGDPSAAWTLDTQVAFDQRSESPPRRTTSSATDITLENSKGSLEVPSGLSEGAKSARAIAQPGSNSKMRICSKCKEEKPFPGSFHRAGLNRSGVITYRPDCADCHRALDRVAKRMKRAQQKNPSGGSAAKHAKVVSLTQHLDDSADEYQ